MYSAGIIKYFLLFSDAPKIKGPVVVYTWEGNSVNITCEVLAYPTARVSWLRDGQLLPSSNFSNIKIHSSPLASSLEVQRKHNYTYFVHFFKNYLNK